MEPFVSSQFEAFLHAYCFVLCSAVAKALRKVSEGKASAQAEAAEWKRKYELERVRNLQLEKNGIQFRKRKKKKLLTVYS